VQPTAGSIPVKWTWAPCTSWHLCLQLCNVPLWYFTTATYLVIVSCCILLPCVFHSCTLIFHSLPFLELLKVGQIPQRRIFRIIVSDQMPFLSPNQAVSKHCRGLTSALGMVIGKHHPFSVNQPVPLMDWMLHFLHWFCSVSIHLHLHYSSLWMWWNLHSHVRQHSNFKPLSTYLNLMEVLNAFLWNANSWESFSRTINLIHVGQIASKTAAS